MLLPVRAAGTTGEEVTVVGGLLLLNLSGDGASSVGCATWQVPD